MILSGRSQSIPLRPIFTHQLWFPKFQGDLPSTNKVPIFLHIST